MGCLIQSHVYKGCNDLISVENHSIDFDKIIILIANDFWSLLHQQKLIFRLKITNL